MKNERERKRERTKENKERESSSASSSRCRVREEDVMRAADILGMSPVSAMKWMDYQDEIGWCYKDGTPVTRYNFRRSLRMWREMSKKVNESRLVDAEREKARKERETKKANRPMTSAERHQAEIEEAEARRRAENAALAASLKVEL